MLPYLLYAAGLAAVSLLSTGCASQGRVPPPRSKPPQPATGPNPLKAAPPPGPAFPKALLQIDELPEGANGYQFIRQTLRGQLNANQGNPIPLKNYLLFRNVNNPNDESLFLDFLIQHPDRAKVARNFIDQVAQLDGNPDDLSSYDYLVSSFYLYARQWKEPWGKQFFLEHRAYPYAPAEHIKTLGRPLLDAGDGTLATQSRDLLQSLAVYLKAQPPGDPNLNLIPLVDFFLTGKDPEVFTRSLHISYHDFLTGSPEDKAGIFQQAVEAQWPTPEMVEGLYPYLENRDLFLLKLECFKKDPQAALALFEQVSLPENFSLGINDPFFSDEVKLFPNLPQDTPFPERQAAIDAFLGEPALVEEKKHYWGAAKTKIKKYLWPFGTEVFSIESGKPGPTTLVFSPHFHEPNPRKYFHWIKDLPLKSGRVILIPEANRAMGRAREETNPMNRIFNRALLSERMDYVIVRRVEYLIGLVDGVIGDHDAWKGPFYISDVLVDENGEGKPSLGPKPSPWVPKEVLKIKEINYDAEAPEAPTQKTEPEEDAESKPPKILSENQVQWQIAEYSRKKLRQLTGRDFFFEPEAVQDETAHSIITTTGYTQYRLGKPAMTFEGNKKREHGRLHAMAIYTLLRGFGHKIDARFEKKLKDPLPKMEPELYRGNHVTLTNLPEEETKF